MYRIGQTLWDFKDEEVVLYLGNYGAYREHVFIMNRDGSIRKSFCPLRWDRFTNIVNKKREPVYGKEVRNGINNGIPQSQFKKVRPDESITVDNVNFFIGEYKHGRPDR